MLLLTALGGVGAFLALAVFGNPSRTRLRSEAVQLDKEIERVRGILGSRAEKESELSRVDEALAKLELRFWTSTATVTAQLREILDAVEVGPPVRRGVHSRRQISIRSEQFADFPRVLARLEGGGAFVRWRTLDWGSTGWSADLDHYTIPVFPRPHSTQSHARRWYSSFNRSDEERVKAKRRILEDLRTELGPLNALDAKSDRLVELEVFSRDLVLEPTIVPAFDALGLRDGADLEWAAVRAGTDGHISIEASLEVTREDVQSRLPSGWRMERWERDEEEETVYLVLSRTTKTSSATDAQTSRPTTEPPTSAGSRRRRVGRK